MDSFDEIINSIKSSKVSHKKDQGYKERLLSIVETHKTLMKLMEKVFNEHFIARDAIKLFVANLIRIVESGDELQYSEESINNYLKHYLLQYSSMVSIKDDAEIELVKAVSKDIMNDYKTFLFIIKLLDNDFIFSNMVKMLIGNMNSKLLKKMIFIKNHQ